MSSLLSDAGVPPRMSAELAHILGAESVRALAAMARAQAADGGLRLLGPGGLLAGITKRVLEAALEAEPDEHPSGGNGVGDGSGNQRDGRRVKNVMTEVGTVAVAVPRDRAGAFTGGGDRRVRAAHDRHRLDGGFADRARDDRRRHRRAPQGRVRRRHDEGDGVHDHRPVPAGMHGWRSRPLDAVYPVVTVDAIHVKIRDGRVADRPVYVAMAVTRDGLREVLGGVGRRRR